MFNLGTGELIVVKAPQSGKGLGEGIRNFKSSLKAGRPGR
jgi:Sec-independent protein translocase protein TatA